MIIGISAICALVNAQEDTIEIYLTERMVKTDMPNVPSSEFEFNFPSDEEYLELGQSNSVDMGHGHRYAYYCFHDHIKKKVFKVFVNDELLRIHSIPKKKKNASSTCYASDHSKSEKTVVLDEPEIEKEPVKEVKTVEKDEPLKLPQVIYARSEGQSDAFVPYGSLNGLMFETVEVYNRWGSTVYSATDFSNPWMGQKNGKPIAEGSYYYVIRYLDRSGETVDLTGVVMVIAE